MIRSKIVSYFFALALLVFVVPSANASLSTVFFSLTIDSIQSDADGLWASNGVAVGSTYTGSYVYDDAATNLFTGSGNFDDWNYVSLTSNVPGAATTNPLTVHVADFGASDYWSVVAGYTLPGSAGSGFINLRVDGNWGYAQGSGIDVGTGLGHAILAPPVFNTLLPGSSLRYLDSTGGYSQALGSTSFSTAAPIPEPTTMALFGLGLAGAGALRRRKRQS